MPLPPYHGPNRYANPSYSTGIPRKSTVLSATPQQTFSSNFNTLSCNSKYAAMSERKHQPDLRPLADSKYHQKCIDQILDFCSRNNYSIRKETLNFMSTSEMEKLFSFILSFYEIKIKQNSLDTEITRVMEGLNYPYHINKTSLRSYATPKSKGVVLSMIIYLIEPLMLERKSIFNNRDDDYNLQFLKMILNRNQEEKDSFIKQRMNQQLKAKNEIEALIKRTEELKVESHSLDNQEDKLKKLREDVEFLVSQLKDFKSYEEEMRNYVESSSKENDELKKKIEQTKQEIKLLNDKKLELENKIKEQVHSVDEINYYIQRDKQVQIEILKLTEERKKATKEFFDKKLKQDQLFDNLKEFFLKLTDIIRKFKDDLPDARHFNECLQDEKYLDLILFINNPDFDNSETQTFSLDLYTEFLRSIKQSLTSDLLDCKEEICKCQNEVESNLTRKKQLEKKNELIIEQKQIVLQNQEQKKIDLINEIKNKKNEIEDVKSKITAIETDVKLKRKIAMNENLELKTKCQEVKTDFNEYWSSVQNKTVNLENQLKSILPICNEFRNKKEIGLQLNNQLNELFIQERNVVDTLMNAY